MSQPKISPSWVPEIDVKTKKTKEMVLDQLFSKWEKLKVRTDKYSLHREDVDNGEGVNLSWEEILEGQPPENLECLLKQEFTPESNLHELMLAWQEQQLVDIPVGLL